VIVVGDEYSSALTILVVTTGSDRAAFNLRVQAGDAGPKVEFGLAWREDGDIRVGKLLKWRTGHCKPHGSETVSFPR